MPLSEALRTLLSHLYLEFGYPSDQYKRRPKELNRFVRTWNELADRHDAPSEVLHYIVTKRKNDEWVTFDGKHKRLQSMPDDFLTPEQWGFLQEAYTEVLVQRNLGSDNLAFFPDLAKEIGRAFAVRSGRVVLPALLFAAIEAKRKRGEWIKLPGTRDKGIDFGDADQVAG